MLHFFKFDQNAFSRVTDTIFSKYTKNIDLHVFQLGTSVLHGFPEKPCSTLVGDIFFQRPVAFCLSNVNVTVKSVVSNRIRTIMSSANIFEADNDDSYVKQAGFGQDSDSNSDSDCDDVETGIDIGSDSTPIDDEEDEKPKKEAIQSFTLKEIEQKMSQLCEKVTAVSNIPPEAAHLLLSRNKWDPSAVLSAFFSAKSAGEYFKHENIPLGPQKFEVFEIKKKCEVCLLPKTEFYQHSCGDSFCLECWEDFIETEVILRNKSFIECLGVECSTLLGPKIVKDLANDDEIGGKFAELLISAFVDQNPNYTFCPAPDCKRIFSFDPNYHGWKRAFCADGHVVCLECREEWHGPMNCAGFEKWKQQVEDHCLSINWINTNIVPCPFCNTSFEKITARKFVICLTCETQFCKDCLQLHDSYECPNFKSMVIMNMKRIAVNDDSPKELLYFHAKKVAENEKNRIEYRMEQLLGSNGLSSETVTYLSDILRLLTRARLIVANSYGVLSMVPDGVQKELFQYNFQNLKAAVESLTSLFLCEKDPDRDFGPPVSSIKMPDVKLLQPSIDLCNPLINLLEKQAEENFKKNIW